MIHFFQISGLGTVKRPDALGRLRTIEQGGIGQLISLFVTTLITGAGIYALFNFVLAGYAFINAGDDPQKVAGAWSRIYQTIIGLVVAAGALVITAIVSKLFFGTYTYLLSPSIPTA